jgi:hypothetical protein
MDLVYEARIEVSWDAEGDLAAAIDEHAARIASETLATAFMQRSNAAKSEHDTEIDGMPLRLSIAPA